jgi:hypothetical protein
MNFKNFVIFSTDFFNPFLMDPNLSTTLVIQKHINRPKLFNHFISILKTKTSSRDYFTITQSSALYFHIHLTSTCITIISKKPSAHISKTFYVKDYPDTIQNISDIILSGTFDDPVRYVFIDQELTVCTVFENTLKDLIQSKLPPNLCIKFYSYNRYFDLTSNDIRYYDRSSSDRIYSIDCTSLLIKLKTRCASSTKNKVLRMSNNSIYIINYDEIDPKIILDSVLDEIMNSYKDIYQEIFRDSLNIDFLIKYTDIPLQLYLRDKYAVWYSTDSIYKKDILEYYYSREIDTLYFFCRDVWDTIDKYNNSINSLIIHSHDDVIYINRHVISCNYDTYSNKLISEQEFEELIFNLRDFNEDNLSTKHYILEILKGSSLLDKAIFNLSKRSSGLTILFTRILYICELIESEELISFEDSLFDKIKDNLYTHKYNKLLVMIIYIEVNNMWKNNEDYEFFRDINLIKKDENDLVQIIKEFYNAIYKKINFVNLYNKMIEESIPNIIKEYEENK